MDISAIELKFLILAILIIYIPFHLFEEAIGDFPESMYQHKWIPERITHGHWMANNIFFYFPLLVAGFALYLLSQDFLPFGIGILFWGLINFADHLVYSITDRRLSPGFYTGLLFGIVSLTALATHAEKLDFLTITVSVILSLLYAFLPVLLSIAFHKKFKRIFG